MLDNKMTIKMNIDYNPNDFRVFKPQLVGIYRSDTTPVSSNATDLYLRYVSKSLSRPLELEKGFTGQSKKTVINNKFESLLEWIALHKQLFQLNQQREPNNNIGAAGLDGVDFVASTGTLSFLLKIPYELENNFSILAEMLNGTIYLKIKRIVGVTPPPPVSTKPIFRSGPVTTNTPFSCSSKAPQQSFVCDYDLNNHCDQKFRQHFTEKINNTNTSSSNNENVNFQESKLNDWVSFGGKKAGDKSKGHKVTEKITFVFRTKVKKHNIIFSDEVDSFEQIHPMNRDHFGIVKFKLVKKGQADRNEYLDSLRKLR